LTNNLIHVILLPATIENEHCTVERKDLFTASSKRFTKSIDRICHLGSSLFQREYVLRRTARAGQLASHESSLLVLARPRS